MDPTGPPHDPGLSIPARKADPEWQDHLPTSPPTFVRSAQTPGLNLAPPQVRLRPISATPSTEDLDLLRKMRKVCGWGTKDIPFWIEEIGKGNRTQWFVLPSSPSSDPTYVVGESPIGMIALDLLDPRHPQHASIRGSKKVRMSSLFVYPEWRKGGYGAAAVRTVERLAREDYGAEVMTLDTHTVNGPIKYYEDMGYVRYEPHPEDIALTDWERSEQPFKLYMQKELS